MNDVEHLPEDMRKLFRNLIRQNPDLSKRIRDQLKKAQEEKLIRRKATSYGYDIIKGKLVINEDESKVVRWIFERYLAYSENPPEELLKTAIKRARSRGVSVQGISFEEAKSLVTDSLVKEYMAEELSLKELYYHALSEQDTTVRHEDILSLPMEALPKAELKKLSSDISELEVMKKRQEYSRRLNHVLANDLYNDTIVLTARSANRKGMPLETMTIRNEHDPIISAEMFRAVQEKRQTRHEKPKTEPTR